MKINYVENKNGKLFSFHRHDYKDNIDDEDNYIMIDGGFDDYIRCSGELKSGEIKIFKTKRDMSKKLDINRSSVKHAISKNNGLMTRKKIIIEEI